MASSLTDIYSFVTSSGIVVPDTANIKSYIQQKLRDIFGDEIDLTDETPAGRLVDALTIFYKGVLDVNAQNATQINYHYATGTYLDSIAAMFNISRKGATYTRTLCTFTGVNGTVIPSGSLATTTDGYTFSLDTPVMLDTSGSGTGYMTCITSGAIPCTIGTLVNINTSIVGWTAVNNTTAATIGSEIESDDALRARIEAARYYGSCTAEAIYGAISQIDGVNSCICLENGDSNSITPNGAIVAGHSIYVCVDGGNSTAIATAIYKKKTAGCGYTTYTISGTTIENISIVDPNSTTSYVVSFYRPAKLTCSATIVIPKKYENDTETILAIKNYAAQYINSINIGKVPQQFALWNYLVGNIYSLAVNSITLGVSSVYDYQKPVALASDITVTISET